MKKLRLAALLLAAGWSLSAAAQVSRVEDLHYPPLPPFAIPQPERLVLGNGLVVMLLEDHELPLVDATVLIRTGSRFDPADQAGLAVLGARAMRAGGTGSLPGDALDGYLESRAAEIEITAEEDLTRATVSSLAADFPQVFRVFADLLRRPAFDAPEVEVARTQAITDVSRRNDNPGKVALRELRRIVYGADSPYGRAETPATLGAIRRENLIGWHAAAFHPDRMVLGLVGDFQRKEAVALIRQVFGDWPRGAAWHPQPASYRQQPAPGVYYVEKPGIAQSSIQMGHLGVLVSDPDFYALEVLNQVLSGSFSSRLFADVRTRKSLGYAVWGAVDSEWDHPGLASLYLSTKAETTGAGVEALLEEARSLTELPPTEEEVSRARQGLLNSFVFRFDSPREVLARQLLLEYHGYPLDWLSRYRAGIEAVTSDQVRRAARHWRPDDFTILVVGPNQGRDKPLTDFGTVTVLAGASAPARPDVDAGRP
ncbi:MAG TPA: pitrilysin family protein [Thermoanaerobaculia bacterium]|nr:pitrilysin family protein [Thermoanaerobaculia bacterium]